MDTRDFRGVTSALPASWVGIEYFMEEGRPRGRRPSRAPDRPRAVRLRVVRPRAAARASAACAPARPSRLRQVAPVTSLTVVSHSIGSENSMASVAPGPLAAGGAARSLQPLPIGELKSLFINFLEQHGYAVPQEANIILDNAVHCLSGSGRGPSPCPSVADRKRSSSAISSDELSSHSDGTVKGSDVEEGPFQTVIAKRKNRKGIPTELDVDYIKEDLDRQGYPFLRCTGCTGGMDQR
ncbi:hypothetical protein EVAR_28120_1 [Eumeta japonica]|uniref:Uncharacterized protein n=1 Tax=Eumeta variegata TaxID=151549 RepID=A0A4C1VDV3_EUMVA|nr:hypothetical protein EVAR_28120_1 [Eumeta japonica]